MRLLYILFLILFPFKVFAELDEDKERLIGFFSERAETIIEKRGDSYKNLIIFSLKERQEILDIGDEKYEVYTQLIKNISNIGKNGEAKKHYTEYNIDGDKLQTAWLTWQNTVRKNLGLAGYRYDERLNATAFEWSLTNIQKGVIDHKRNSGDAYYDYSKITKWFKERGVVCKNIKRVTNSESIGWGYFSCNDGDCTDESIKAMKDIFDMYMSEKGKANNVHYRGITNPAFEYIGLGISVKAKSENRYILSLTSHYCTELIE